MDSVLLFRVFPGGMVRGGEMGRGKEEDVREGKEKGDGRECE